jgi:hypothetical protein
MPMPGLRGRYAPLLAYLDALSPAAPRVRLSFAELEALLGGPLPPRASVGTNWTSSRVAVLNWRRVGFMAHLDRTGPAVTFTRTPLKE